MLCPFEFPHPNSYEIRLILCMREQKSLRLLLALNILLAGGFLTYLFFSGPPRLPASSEKANLRVSPLRVSASAATWADIETAPYTNYVNKLHEAGCPAERIRQLVLSDLEDYFAHKRLQLALSFDIEWWRDEPIDQALEILREQGQALEEQRRQLTQKLLGPSAAESNSDPLAYWKSIQLTGLVLGSLPPALHQQVQEICARSIQEQETLAWNHASEKQPIPAVDLARLREQARAELRKVLSAEQMEEFLLRFSHNAQELRADLRAFEPTAEEFRKIFRALDPLDHQLQQQFGEMEALSKRQQERYQRQREEAIRQALGPDRFQAFLASKHRLSLR